MENLVKKTAKELCMTYKELGEAIGYSESTINGASRSESLSEPLKKAIELYLENLKLKSDLKDFYELKKILRKM